MRVSYRYPQLGTRSCRRWRTPANVIVVSRSPADLQLDERVPCASTRADLERVSDGCRHATTTSLLRRPARAPRSGASDVLVGAVQPSWYRTPVMTTIARGSSPTARRSRRRAGSDGLLRRCGAAGCRIGAVAARVHACSPTRTPRRVRPRPVRSCAGRSVRICRGLRLWIPRHTDIAAEGIADSATRSPQSNAALGPRKNDREVLK